MTFTTLEQVNPDLHLSLTGVGLVQSTGAGLVIADDLVQATRSEIAMQRYISW